MLHHGCAHGAPSHQAIERLGQEPVVIAEIQPPSGLERPRRVPGMLKGRIRMQEDFDVLPDDVLSALEGNQD